MHEEYGTAVTKASGVSRYVFSEFAEEADLCAPETLSMLAERGIGVYAAITPSNFSSAPVIVAAAREAGVRLGLWPMVDDGTGRWANAWNAIEYIRFTREMLASLDGALPDELLVDLEPPIGATRRAVNGERMRLGKPPQDGWNALTEFFAELATNQMEIAAAIAPWCVCGSSAAAWQWAMGTPIDGMPFDRIFAMAYSSMIEGYSRGFLRRRDARALVSVWARQLKASLGERGILALGIIGRGAIGDEPTYRDPSELADDAAIALAAGQTSLALFDLSGALDRSPAADWLDALAAPSTSATLATETTPPAVRKTVRARTALTAISVTGRWLGRRR